jgi:hypothetical protein
VYVPEAIATLYVDPDWLYVLAAGEPATENEFTTLIEPLPNPPTIKSINLFVPSDPNTTQNEAYKLGLKITVAVVETDVVCC